MKHNLMPSVPKAASRSSHTDQVWSENCSFSYNEAPKVTATQRRSAAQFASASASLSEGVLNTTLPSQASCPPSAPKPSRPKVELKPATDVLAGAVARCASQGTIHPLDTLKVRLQSRDPRAANLSKFVKLLRPPGAPRVDVGKGFKSVVSLYEGVLGAASGAGIYIGTYFAFYGAACNLLSKHTTLSPGAVAFLGGGLAAAGGSVVKVPLAVCIRSVQAQKYKNAFHAATSIVAATGPRGLFVGWLPTIIEDIPDMAFKFAAYETLRSVHKQVHKRNATAQEDFIMGAISGAFAAACTTPLDVVKTQMMCSASKRPTMGAATRELWTAGGPRAFFPVWACPHCILPRLFGWLWIWLVGQDCPAPTSIPVARGLEKWGECMCPVCLDG
eukprot:jgi/Botrbrau1/18679/Bobra.0386s0008.1